MYCNKAPGEAINQISNILSWYMRIVWYAILEGQYNTSNYERLSALINLVLKLKLMKVSEVKFQILTSLIIVASVSDIGQNNI